METELGEQLFGDERRSRCIRAMEAMSSVQETMEEDSPAFSKDDEHDHRVSASDSENSSILPKLRAGHTEAIEKKVVCLASNSNLRRVDQRTERRGSPSSPLLACQTQRARNSYEK